MGSYFRHCIFLILFTLLLPGCADLNLQPGGSTLELFPKYNFTNLPFDQYWTGISFNGSKIGFSHLKITPDPELNNIFVLETESIMAFRLQGYDKQIVLKSRDRVRQDLSLVDFVYEFQLDGTTMLLQGATEYDGLRVLHTVGSDSIEILKRFSGTIYPFSVMGLFPSFKGLQKGRRFSYTVFDGESQTLSQVEQEILAYEESDLFTGKAYKIRSTLQGQEVEVWICEHGLPVLEMTMGGLFISDLQTEEGARNYLAEATLNKSEAFLEFSLIKVEDNIEEPHRARSMGLSLQGVPESFIPPAPTKYQSCTNRNGTLECRTNATGSLRGNGLQDDELAKKLALQATHVVPKDNEEIRELAKQVTTGGQSGAEKVEKILAWMAENIGQTPADVFSALDVLHSRKAECQGHAFLFAALARSQGLPTRVVNGIVYSDLYKGFLYHTWVEVLLEQGWLPVDPTFNQAPADATHLKLVEGEILTDLAPLIDMVGKLKVKDISVQ